MVHLEQLTVYHTKSPYRACSIQTTTQSFRGIFFSSRINPTSQRLKSSLQNECVLHKLFNKISAEVPRRQTRSSLHTQLSPNYRASISVALERLARHRRLIVLIIKEREQLTISMRPDILDFIKILNTFLQDFNEILKRTTLQNFVKILKKCYLDAATWLSTSPMGSNI